MAVYLRKLFAKNPSDLSEGVDKSAPLELYEMVDETGAPVGLPVSDAPIVALGHQTVTVTNAAATLAALLAAAAGTIPSVPADAREVWLWPVTGDVVITLDGSTPVKATDTTLRGSLIAQDMQRSFRFSSAAAIGAIKLIGSANVVLSIEFRG